MFLYNAVYDAEAESGTFTDVFRGIKWFEDMFLNVFGDSNAVVRDSNLDVPLPVTGLYFYIASRHAAVAVSVAGDNCVSGIDYDI